VRLGALTLAVVLFSSFGHADAQSAGRVPGVGYLGFLNEPPDASPHRDAFFQGLRDLGYVPGQNIMVEVLNRPSLPIWMRQCPP
jgi:hypothetical protein